MVTIMEMMIQQDNTLDQMVLQSALRDRRIQFIEEFTRESVFKAIYLMNRIKANDDKVDLPKEDRIIYIDFASYGGCAYSCLALISLIEKLKEDGYIIISHTHSFAMSAGFFTSVVCSYRTMARYGVLLNHQVNGGFIGKMQDMKEDMQETERIWNVLKTLVAKYTNITDEKMEDMRSRKLDWYIDAESALELGCIDEII